MAEAPRWNRHEDEALIAARLAASRNTSNQSLAQRLAPQMRPRTVLAIAWRLSYLKTAIAARRAGVPAQTRAKPGKTGPNLAAMSLKAHQRARFGVLPQRSQRACMCCRKTFWSDGPHNRLCIHCRQRDVSPYAPYVPDKR